MYILEVIFRVVRVLEDVVEIFSWFVYYVKLCYVEDIKVGMWIFCVKVIYEVFKSNRFYFVLCLFLFYYRGYKFMFYSIKIVELFYV